MKKIYDSFLKLLSENNKNKTISIVSDFNKGVDYSTIIEKYSIKPLEKNYNSLVEEKNLSIELFKHSLTFKIQTDLNDKYNFETILNINLDINYNSDYELGFNISKKKEENTLLLYLAFKEEDFYSCSTVDTTIDSVILNKGNQIINNNKSKEIINLVLNNMTRPLELKDLLLINCDVDVEQDELLFNIYQHGLILNDNQKKTKIELKNNK